MAPPESYAATTNMPSHHHHSHHHGSWSAHSPAIPSKLSISSSNGGGGSFHDKPSDPQGARIDLSWLANLVPTFGVVKLCIVVLLWYSCSSLTNNLGKILLNNFNFPLTLTIAQFGFITLFTLVYAQFIKVPKGKTTLLPISGKVLKMVLPLVAFNVIGHSFSSIAIANVPVSFVHTVKALSPFFTVLFSKIFLPAHYSLRIYFSLVPLTVGVILACSSELSFNALGFLASLASTVIFVAQNIFSKKLFQDGKMDELNLLYYSSLFAFVAMIPLWVYQEGYALVMDPPGSLTSHVKLLFLANGVTHFGQNIFAFTLLTLVSPVAYSIGSLLKRIFIIVTSILWFQTPVTTQNLIGMTLTFTGLWLYTTAKSEVKKPSASVLPLAHTKGEPESPTQGGVLHRNDSEMVLSYERS